MKPIRSICEFIGSNEADIFAAGITIGIILTAAYSVLMELPK